MSQLRISEELYPRLTVLITTCSSDGRFNVATFSFIMPVSFEPKYLAFSVSPHRQTFKNLNEIKEFVVNIPTEDMLDKVWICGTKSGRDVNKFELAKLEIIDSRKVKPPRIKNCPIQLECKVEFMKEFGDHYIVVGRVVEEHIDRMDFKPLLHHSGRQFYRLGEKVVK
ncbi:MAG: flavin reductase family protein [Candidatus Nezhaarchaeota archaeon]|nr:flavin reductase family protein [Candidatus Nezhaarchaeota archaeon]MCX8141591.1 flavin reductase family protein [Candidatus Nezhaarchaeota archaeon]MDW8049858.1 flavin reductase family protein [Nitrososphaerota archaeon]